MDLKELLEQLEIRNELRRVTDDLKKEISALCGVYVYRLDVFFEVGILGLVCKFAHRDQPWQVMKKWTKADFMALADESDVRQVLKDYTVNAVHDILGTPWKIQIELVGGDWEDMGEERYDTEEAALDALREFKKDAVEAKARGDMEDDYVGEDFRVTR